MEYCFLFLRDIRYFFAFDIVHHNRRVLPARGVGTCLTKCINNERAILKNLMMMNHSNLPAVLAPLVETG
jgi:hypothetical protein